MRSGADKIQSLAIATSGATAVVTQIVLLREFLSVFYGNELIIGVVLADWLILTGIGSALGRRAERAGDITTSAVFLMVSAALLPSATVFSLYYIKSAFFPPGSMIGIIQIFGLSFILLMPFCLVSGALFTVFSLLLSSEKKEDVIPRVYALDALGSIAGGIAFNLFIIRFLPAFGALALIGTVGLAACFLLASSSGRPGLRHVPSAAGLLLLSLFFSFRPDALVRDLLYKGQQVLYSKATRYGALTVTKHGDQKNFYENNLLLYSTGDMEFIEESVHYAMAQHRRPRQVLLISGGISGMTGEILKYGADRVDYIELNPELISIGRRETSALDDPRIHAIAEDARRYIKRTGQAYDVVLIVAPDPVTAQINRYYTAEFFAELKKRLTREAVISIGLLPAADYLGSEAKILTSVLYHTLRGSFEKVVIVPGWKNYFIASDRDLRTDLAAAVEERGINTVYVNRYYIDDELVRRRGEEIMRQVVSVKSLNEDFSPIGYFMQLRYWLGYFRGDWPVPALIFGALFLVLVIRRLNVVSLGVFTAGFASMTSEIILIIAFQVICGYMFHMTGLIITSFMAGLYTGSRYRRSIFKTAGMKEFSGLLFSVSAFSCCLPQLLVLLKTGPLPQTIIQAIFCLLAFAGALMTGLGFSIASGLRQGRVSAIASELYGMDLFGSSLGALLVTSLLVPLFGLVKSGYIAGGITLIGGIVARLTWIRQGNK